MSGKSSVDCDLEHQLNGRHLWAGFKGTLGKYVFAGKFVGGKVCLDLACGIGYSSNYLARSAAVTVGGDVSRRALEYAGTRYAARDGLHFVQLDAHQLPFRDESFEVVVSIETIEHLERPRQFLGECFRVLKPGGCLICSTPNKAMSSPYSKRPLYSWHVQEFELHELCQLAEEYFREVTIFGQFMNKDLSWRFNVLAGQFIGPLIRSLPKGEFIAYLLNRFVLQRKPVSLGELDTRLLEVEDDVLPFPQMGKELGCIVLVARR